MRFLYPIFTKLFRDILKIYEIVKISEQDDVTCSQERSLGEIMTPKEVAKINIYKSYTKTST